MTNTRKSKNAMQLPMSSLLLPTLLVAALVLSLTACGSKETAGTSSLEQTGTEQRTEASGEEAAEGTESSDAAVLTASEGGTENAGEEASEEGTAAESDPPEAAGPSVSALVFVTGDVTIAMDEEAAPILEQLGEYSDYLEYVGCAGLGVMKYYYFSGFELCTYQDAEEVDLIYSVSFENDVIETPEGLCIGDTADRALELYGELAVADDYVIQITMDNTTLIIALEDGYVTSIQYISKAASAKYT
ncbi:MAG: hypothetical protein HUJ69_08380 [Lachnospiraceae bacterium]|nr:hypothetical protein [Lachnospiraceae bacterium]